MTTGQERAYTSLKPVYELAVTEAIDLAAVFQNQAPSYLEIGFGTGQSLLAAASENPTCNFIGVETHKPGVGALFLGIEEAGLTNLRVMEADVVDVLTDCIADNTLAGIQIFFPDPWQKRKHHIRRLIQSEFLTLAAAKLIPGGTIHLATDWEHYAMHMLKVVLQTPAVKNLSGETFSSTRSEWRPIESKFERRAIKEGRQIWELQLQKA